MEEKRTKFIDQILDYYGPKGIHRKKHFKNQPAQREEIALALEDLEEKSPEKGHSVKYDSFDRELVRDILLFQRGVELDHSEIVEYLGYEN